MQHKTTAVSMHRPRPVMQIWSTTQTLQSINKSTISKPNANSCDVQSPQATHLDSNTTAAPPASSPHSQPAAPPLFMMPKCPILQTNCLPLNSCRTVSLCSLDHVQHIRSSRPKLNYKKLEKPIPLLDLFLGYRNEPI